MEAPRAQAPRRAVRRSTLHTPHWYQALQRWRLRRWLTRRLQHNDAVIIDTETTDLNGHCIQLSIIDMHGTVLLDTLIKPPVPVAAEATRCHGITDSQLLQAPRFPDIVEELNAITRGRTVLAYNAPYDQAVINRAFDTYALPHSHLRQQRNWRCLMRTRSIIEDTKWRKLEGPHNALGDCQKALEIVNDLAPTTKGRTQW